MLQSKHCVYQKCPREEHKNMALVLTERVACSALAGSSPSTQGLTAGGQVVVLLSLSVMQCCVSLLEGENAITSGNDVVIIAFVCCAAVWTLKIHIQRSDTAFFSLYAFICCSALRHIDLILSFLMLCVV